MKSHVWGCASVEFIEGHVDDFAMSAIFIMPYEK